MTLEWREAPIFSQFVLDKAEWIVPHSNSVCFGNTRYREDDEFPLLYSNIYNNYAKTDHKMKGVTCVYRLERREDTFTSTLVQLIEIGFVEDPIWKSENCNDVRPYGNCVIDTESPLFYAFSIPNIDSGVYDSTFGVKRVILKKEDIVDYFDCEYHRYVQGACCHNKIIYSLEGFTNDQNNPPAIRLIDIGTGKQKEMHYFKEFDMSIEPELIDFSSGTCYYADCRGNL